VTPARPTRTLVRHDLATTGGRYLLVYGELRGEPPHDDGGTGDGAELHQRLDRLTDSWLAVSPSRNVRPHSSLDRRCPLCPGGPELPFSYEAAVFENRFPSFRSDPPQVADDPRLARSVGRCEVVLYTERHEGSLATLTPDELANVVGVWRDRSAELWADAAHRFVMVFENRGEGVGATLSHPHGQIYAFDRMPPLIAMRLRATVGHREATGGCLGCLVVAEDDASERILADNPSFAVAVPFAPHWPYEVHVRARRHGVRRLGDLEPAERRDLAAALRDVVLRYDGLFGVELPYMMVLLEAPADVGGGEPDGDWHFAVEFYPPHRTERLTKVRASVETATGLFINDTLPETSAARLAGIAVAAPSEAEAVPVDVVRSAPPA
jgi:UDPglucose--hexose-1-phosphate uridylyltransferase